MVVFDHVALDIVLPGVLTQKERRYFFEHKKRRALWKSMTGHDITNHQYGWNILDPDFDENPIHRWHGATN